MSPPCLSKTTDLPSTLYKIPWAFCESQRFGPLPKNQAPTSFLRDPTLGWKQALLGHCCQSWKAFWMGGRCYGMVYLEILPGTVTILLALQNEREAPYNFLFTKENPLTLNFLRECISEHWWWRGEVRFLATFGDVTWEPPKSYTCRLYKT